MNSQNSRSRLGLLGTLMIAAFLLCYSTLEKSKSTARSPLELAATLTADGSWPAPPPPPPPVKQSQSFVALA